MIFGKSKPLVLCLALIAILSLSAQAFGYEYWAGVKKGQFIQYGSFEGSGTGMQAFNENDWMKYEVANVNNTEVDLILTGQFKNGTALLGNGDTWVYDVITLNRVNGTFVGQNPIIAADLYKHELLTPYSSDFVYVNDTISRVYLGENRTVNLLNFTSSNENGTYGLTYYYDRASGMLLEMIGQTTDSNGIRQFSYTVTDTNIFGPKAGIPTEYWYAAVAAGAAVAVTVIVIVVRNRKNKSRRHRR
jgi:hypothetical protein